MRPITGLEGSRIGLMIYLMACPWNFLYVFVSRGYSIGNIKGGKEMSQYDTDQEQMTAELLECQKFW